MSSCFMLPMEKPFQVDRQIQHHWSRDNPFIPVRIEEEEDYIENNETWWKAQRAKGKSVIFWRYFALEWLWVAEKHTLPSHPHIDKQMPSRRSERSEGSGGHWSPTFRREPEPDLPPVHDKKIWWQRARRDSPSTPATANKYTRRQPFHPINNRQLQTRSHKLQQEEIVKTTEEVTTMSMSSCFMLLMEQPFHPSNKQQTHVKEGQK